MRVMLAYHLTFIAFIVADRVYMMELICGITADLEGLVKESWVNMSCAYRAVLSASHLIDYAIFTSFRTSSIMPGAKPAISHLPRPLLSWLVDQCHPKVVITWYMLLCPGCLHQPARELLQLSWFLHFIRAFGHDMLLLSNSGSLFGKKSAQRSYQSLLTQEVSCSVALRANLGIVCADIVVWLDGRRYIYVSS